MRNQGWYGVDLDGTLAFYDGFKGPLEIGEPIPKMQERVKEWIAKGREVRIVTARVSGTKGDRDVEEVRVAIEDWCEKHLGKRLQVTNEKDFGMIELWDDRAVQVIPNTGVRPDVDSALRAVITYIYLEDSADVMNYMWDVLQALATEEMLKDIEEDPEKAYKKYCE